MKCKVEWSDDFIEPYFTKTFVNTELREHRKKRILEFEKSHLPDTVQFLELDKRMNTRTLQIRELQRQMNDLQFSISTLQNANQKDYNKLNSHGSAVEEPEQKERQTINKKCPGTDCRGFLNTKWICAICSTAVCSKCHEIKAADGEAEAAAEDTHVCDPANVETAKAIMRQTKPCPGCTSPIYKIDGCFGINTSIRLFDGSVKMSQDIVVGDILFGDDGTPRPVTATTTGQDQLYSVSQLNGDNYVVNSKHTLVLKFVGDRIILWTDIGNSWAMRWFDHENRIMIVKQIKVGAITKDAAYAEMVALRDTITFPDTIEITVDEFMALGSAVKARMVGFKCDKPDSPTTGITVSPLSDEPQGTYYGFSVSGPSMRFALADGTCVHNCRQMWCTQCHTAFDWETLEIEKYAIHNPHYYEYRRTVQNVEGAVAQPAILNQNCDRLPEFEQMHAFLRAKYGARWNADNIERNMLEYIHRGLLHITLVEIPFHRPQTMDERIASNRQMRMRYLRNEIDEKRMVDAAYRDERKQHKMRAMHQVMEMILIVGANLMNRVLVDRPTDPTNKIIKEFNELRRYYNTQMTNISARFNYTQTSFVDEKWNFRRRTPSVSFVTNDDDI